MSPPHSTPHSPNLIAVAKAVKAFSATKFNKGLRANCPNRCGDCYKKCCGWVKVADRDNLDELW